MAGRRFDTCFFERYAQLTLERLLGDDYSDLINEDRPDLQKTDKSLGIEVTRAMEESKDTAIPSLNNCCRLVSPWHRTR